MDEKSTSGEPGGRLPPQGEQASLQGAFELLSARRYERVEQLLQEQQEAAQRSGQMAMVVILAAACQLCLTCKQFHADRELHQLGYEEAARRERELRQQIQAVLTMLGELSSAEPQAEANLATNLPLTPPEISGPAERKSAEHPSLFGKVKQLLGFEPSSPLEESKVATVDSTGGKTPAAESRKEATPTLVEKRTSVDEDPVTPSLVVYCLGPFRVYQNDRLITEWSGLKSQLIFKYLVAQKGMSVAKEVLMDVFWADSEPEAARRNLHQAIYSLRQTLRRGAPSLQHILFEHNRYLLNPEMELWFDFEEFQKHVQAGRRLESAGQPAEAMAEYGISEGLYQGDFLEEVLYEEWCRWQREQIRDMYLDISDRLSEYYLQNGEYAAAMALCQKELAGDTCYEQAHFRLMRCYLAQHQRHMAVRQYQICRELLKSELELEPSEETTALYRKLTA